MGEISSPFQGYQLFCGFNPGLRATRSALGYRRAAPSGLSGFASLALNRIKMRWILGIIWLAMSLALGTENAIVLQTELKVQSVGVAVRAPLGWQYRAGELFLLEVFVDNPGAAMSAEIALTEGNASGGFAERTAPVVSLPSGKSRHVLSARTSPVAPALSLSIRSHSDGGGSAELFRASLSPLLSPLPAGGRLILVCSNSPAGRLASLGPNDSSPHCSAKELPDQLWMWESVDWLVLSDGAIKDINGPVRAVVNAWLAGGGRIFLGSAEALSAAHKQGLLPLSAEKPYEAEVSWWEKNAGLRKENVLAEKNFRPVFAWLSKGLGKVVFLFPGANAGDADGAAVFNRVELQRPRANLPDVRIQPERYEMFAPAVAGAGRRSAVLWWAALGAVLIGAALFYAHSSKSKLEAAILPFGAALLLAALISHGFPRAELLASRVCFERHAADSSLVKDEWTMLEAFRRPMECSVRGTAGATVAPIFDEPGDLRSAGLSRSIEGGRMKLDGVVVRPGNTMLFQTRSTSTEPLDATIYIDSKDTFNVTQKIHDNAKSGLWLSVRGELKALFQNQTPGEFSAETITEKELARKFDLSDSQAVTIQQVLRDARAAKQEIAVFWHESGRQKNDDSAQLVEIEPPASYESDFVVRIFSQRSY